MTLNCKPGKLARVVNPKATAYGYIVTTVELLPPGSDGWHPNKGPIWRLDRPLPVHMAMGVLDVESYTYTDATMRLIDDPGDNAVDEMVRKVGPAPRVKVKEVQS